MIIFLILILSLILRLISLNQSLWLDEAINTLAVQNYSLIDLITQYARADFHPPGYFIILWIWGKFFGFSEIVVRMPSVIFGVLTVWIVYLIGKKLITKEVGIIAAILLAINPLHIYYSQEARMYALATLAVSINIFLLIKIVNKEKLNLFLFVLSNIGILASDYIAYFIFPGQLVFLWFYKKEFIKKWFILLFVALAFGIWWLPIFLNQLSVGSIASDNLPAWKFINGAFDFKTLPLTFVKFIIGRISLSDKFIYATLILPVCILFLFLLLRGIKSLNDFSRKILTSWLIIPLLAATLVSFFIPVYSYFRVLFVIPSLILLISVGVLSFKRRLKYIFLILVILIQLFCALVYLLNPIYQREDWRGLVNFLRNKNENVLVLFESSGTFPPFDYYNEGSINAIGALKVFPAKNENDVIDLQNLLNQDIYLVNYLVEISDNNKLVEKGLNKIGYRLTNTIDFHGVGFVYHYVKE